MPDTSHNVFHTSK